MFPFCNPWCGDSFGGGLSISANNSNKNILTIPTAATIPPPLTPNSESLRKKQRQHQFREDFVVVKLQELVDCKTKQQAEDIILEIDSCIREDDDNDNNDGSGTSSKGCSSDNDYNGVLLDVLESLGAIYIIHDLMNHPDDKYRRPSPDIAAPLLYKLLTRVEEEDEVNTSERNGQPIAEVNHAAADDDSLIQDRDDEVISNSTKSIVVPPHEAHATATGTSSNIQREDSQPQQQPVSFHDSISIPLTTTKEMSRTSLIMSYVPSSSSTPSSAPYLLPAMTNNRTVL